MFDRAVTLLPHIDHLWYKYVYLDYSRARVIFELGTSQQPLSYPENLWKTYIDFEFEWGEWQRMRDMYERLVRLRGHVKVWRAYAEFEASPIFCQPGIEGGQRGDDVGGRSETGSRGVREAWRGR